MATKIRIYNSILNPDIWDSEHNIIPEVSAHLLKIGNDFYNSTELKAKIKDILLLGSSANFNWSPNSDIDIHILIDFKELNISDKEDSRAYCDALASKWNIEHDIKLKNYNVEVYIQDITDNNRSSSIYSLNRGMWVKPPVKNKINIDKIIIKSKFDDYIKKIRFIEQNPEEGAIKNLIADIYNMREVGLSSVGDVSNENIVFKALRTKGYIKKLKLLKNRIYDKSVSL